MNIFKLHEGYRDVGINYGLPVFYIDIGLGMRLEPDDIIKDLLGRGLEVGNWVVIRGECLKEQGLNFLVEGLRVCKAHIEIEVTGEGRTPTFFMNVDRWTVEYRERGKFNYGALRPNRDLLICKEEDLGKVEDLPTLKGLVVEDPKEAWPIVKGTNIRVYRKVQ